MTRRSEYKLRKRIKELECENREVKDKLFFYRNVVTDIYDATIKLKSTESLNPHWVLSQCKRVFK